MESPAPHWYCQNRSVIGEPIKGSSHGTFKTVPHAASEGQLMAYYPAAENCIHPAQNFCHAPLKILSGLKTLRKATHCNQAH